MPDNKLILALLTTALASSPALCAAAPVDVPTDSTITVTATRTESPTSKTASSVTVVTRKQLEAGQQPLLVDALKSVPGLYIAQTGGPGGTASIFMRGANAGDTLVMIDGVPVNDTSSPNRSFDLANIPVNNIDRVEILRGAQSTLYGSDAMAGVINIITAKGHTGRHVSVSLGVGQYRTGQGSISASGDQGGWNYSAAISRFSTQGFPSADLQPNDTHNDAYNNTSFSARLDRELNDAVHITAIDHYFFGTDNYPDFPSTIAINNGAHVAKSEEHVHRIESSFAPVGKKGSFVLGFGSNDINRNYTDEVTGQAASSGHYNGQSSRFDLTGNYKLDSKNTLTLGAEKQRDQSDFTNPFDSAPKAHVINSALFGQDQIIVTPRWSAVIGGRIDNHEIFGKKATYRIASSYTVGDSGTRIKGAFGTGFKAPSLFQLYDPFSGNAALKAENSKSFDIGVEQPLGSAGAAGLTYFKNNYDNLIGYSSEFKYINTASAETHGFEATLRTKFSQKLTGIASYTYTHTQDEKGMQLLRRPESAASLILNCQYNPKTSFNLEARYAGSRPDIKFNEDFSSTTIQLPAYTLVNIAGSYNFTETTSLFARVDNLLNKHYEEIYSYATPGRGIYAGIQAKY